VEVGGGRWEVDGMEIDNIVRVTEALGGVLTLRPQQGDGSPEIAWGDVFFYYAPDGVVPATQPFATVVTKDYPDDRASALDRPGAFRLNVAAGKAELAARTGHAPVEAAPAAVDPSAPDALFPHPVYGRLGWVSVVNPGPRTTPAVHELLAAAHAAARARYERRAASGR
jgi:Family of unknown function (DUF6194)